MKTQFQVTIYKNQKEVSFENFYSFDKALYFFNKKVNEYNISESKVFIDGYEAYTSIIGEQYSINLNYK